MFFSGRTLVVNYLFLLIIALKKLDEWHHKLSGDNPADTGTRTISSKALRESCWVKGPSLPKTTDWLFKPKKKELTFR